MQTEQQKVSALKAGALMSMGVSVFIMLTGIVEILPDTYFPDGALFFTAGFILLLVSFIIEMKKLDHVGFQVMLGFILMLNGVNNILELDIKVMPAFLIIIGFSYFYSLSLDKFKNTKEEGKAYVKAKASKGS